MMILSARTQVDDSEKWLGRTWCELRERYFRDRNDMIGPMISWADLDDCLGRTRKTIGIRDEMQLSRSLIGNKPKARRIMLHEMVHQVTNCDHGKAYAAEAKRVSEMLGISVQNNMARWLADVSVDV